MSESNEFGRNYYAGLARPVFSKFFANILRISESPWQYILNTLRKLPNISVFICYVLYKK